MTLLYTAPRALILALAFSGLAAARNDESQGPQRRVRDEARAPQAQAQGQVQVRIGATFSDRDREAVRDWYGDRARQAGRCPPGLAKKNNGCLPPGQAKKYEIGRPLPPDVVWYAVPSALVTRLPPLPPDHGYIRVGADILLMDRRSRVVIDVAAAFPL